MPDQEWITIKAKWGSYQVPANSLAAMALDPQEHERKRIECLEHGRMHWSLSKFADLLWMTVPEARPIITELAKKELDDANRHDTFLEPIRDYSLADSLYVELLLPAMEDMPAQEDMVRRCLGVFLRLIMEADSHYYWEALKIEVFDPLESKGWRELLAALNPKLAAIRKQILEAREQKG